MKAYVITTGVAFGLLTLAHLLRIVGEDPGLAADPFYLAITAASAALCVWAFVVLRRARHRDSSYTEAGRPAMSRSRSMPGSAPDRRTDGEEGG